MIGRVGRRGVVAAVCAVLAAAWAAEALRAQPRSAQVTRSQLAWVDRGGKRLSVVGDLADFGNIELSPDGRRVAAAVLNESTGARELWLYDATGGGRSRLDANTADENWLIWSPDGRRVAFNSQRTGGLDLYLASPVAGGREDLLAIDRGRGQWPVSWSPDGQNLLVVVNSAETGNDIWVQPLTGNRTPYPFLRTRAEENWAAFSPNGKWVAYSLRAEGGSETELYVTPFPGGGPRWLVSRMGGFQARWRRDGGELFFLAATGAATTSLMAADVNGGSRDFEVDGVKALFETHIPYPPFHAFDVSSDGQRFLVNTLLLGPAGAPRIARNGAGVPGAIGSDCPGPPLHPQARRVTRSAG